MRHSIASQTSSAPRDDALARAAELLARHREGDSAVEATILTELEAAFDREDSFAAATLVRVRAHLLRDRGDVQEALALATHAAHDFETLNEYEELVATLRLCASCYVNMADLSGCLEVLSRAEILAEEHRLERERLEVFLAQTFSALETQRQSHQLDSIMSLESHFMRILPEDRQVTVLNNLASSLCQVGRFEEALAYADRGLAIFGEARPNSLKAFLLNNRATALSPQLPFEEAFALAQEAERLFASTGKQQYVPIPTLELGAAYIKLERFEEARKCLEYTKDRAVQLAGGPLIPRVWEELSIVYERLGLTESALAALRTFSRLRSDRHERDLNRLEANLRHRFEAESAKREPKNAPQSTASNPDTGGG